MRVAPLNHHYQLVVETDPLLQLDSIKNRVSRGCASFSCFSCGCGGASAGLDTTTTTTTTPCPLKVEPLQHHPVVSSLPPPESVAVPEKDKDYGANKADVVAVSEKDKDYGANKADVVAVSEKDKDHDSNKADNDNSSSKEAFKLSLRSSLKRPPSVVESRTLEDIKEDEETLSVHDDASDLTAGGDDSMGKRKVKWPDACGSELTQVREFEPSEMGLSDEEWETGRQRTCSCVIM